MTVTNKMFFIKKCLLILLFLAAGAGFITAEITFSQTQWDIGDINKGDIDEIFLVINNNDASALNISFISTCDCVTVGKAELLVPSGESARVGIEFDSRDDSGEFEKYIIIRADRAGLEKVLFFIYGNVITGEADNTVSADVEAADQSADVSMDFYYTPGCRSCIKFLNDEVPALETELGISINVNRYNILEPASFEDFEEEMDRFGIDYHAFPVLVVNNTVLQGEDEIKEKLKKLLADSSVSVSEDTSGDNASGRKKIYFLPAVSAGLLDGINPCAFTTLIFLLAALAAAGKARKEVLIIGIFFSLSVFITYFLIGLGFFKTLRFAESFSVISDIIRWVLFSILLVFAGISLWDYRVIKKGNAGKILLQLPMSMKKRIHKSVRTYSRSTALIGSSIVMGFFVSIFELGCTGQIYFPTIAYLVQVEKEFSGYLLLAVYNIGFITPLLLVFLFTYTGVSSEKITKLFQRNMGKVKIGTAILFVGLAVLTILT